MLYSRGGNDIYTVEGSSGAESREEVGRNSVYMQYLFRGCGRTWRELVTHTKQDMMNGA